MKKTNQINPKNIEIEHVFIDKGDHTEINKFSERMSLYIRRGSRLFFRDENNNKLVVNFNEKPPKELSKYGTVFNVIATLR